MIPMVIFYYVLNKVVPGRIVRMMVELNAKTLSLKQSFVRYVSHEIRSIASCYNIEVVTVVVISN